MLTLALLPSLHSFFLNQVFLLIELFTLFFGRSQVDFLGLLVSFMLLELSIFQTEVFLGLIHLLSELFELAFMSTLLFLSLDQVVGSFVAFGICGSQIGFTLLFFSLQSLDSNLLHVLFLLQTLRFEVKLRFLIVGSLLILLSLRNCGIELVKSCLLTSDRFIRLL